MAGGFASCSGDKEYRQEDVPINFASVSAETEVITRANPTLGKDFVVYGYKNVNSAVQTVFNGYTVTYSASSAGTSESNTHNYEYVHGNQTIKYWDYGASEYNFWAYTGSKSDFNTDGTTLTITGLNLSVTESADIDQKLFSHRYHRQSVTPDVVQLQFLRPYAKVRVMFYTSEEMTGSDKIQLTNIIFGGGTNSIATAGKIAVSYGKTGTEKENIIMTATGHKDYLAFGDTTLDKDHGTTSNNAVLAVPTGGTEWYYTLPLSTEVSAQPFTMSVSIDGDSKTATVPDAYMHWNPNTSYTYIFKITEAGKKIEFYDVLIDPWKYGGSQNEVWKNW